MNMEPDKLEKIRRNLHQLVKHTICKAPLLEFLVEKNVFDISDIAAIKAIRGETEQASEFYNIIQTRVNSYPVLIQGLHETDQSDIAAILEEGIIPPGLNERSRVRKLLYEPEGAVQLGNKFSIPRSNVRFNISSPVELFTGRTKEMEKLHESVLRSGGMAQPTVISQITAISGLGGIGKTQLARQYVKKHGKDYDGNCIWLHAETEQDLLESFRTLAKDKLEITTKDANGTEKDISIVVEDVYKYFEKSRCLFIFDNAEKTSWLLKFLPKNTKSVRAIILTSRNKEWDNGIDVIEMTELPVEDAVAMVKMGLGLEEDDSQNKIILQLVRKLQCFPLALQQAISYIQVQQEMDGYSIEDYLGEFKKSQQELMSFGGEDELNFELFNDYTMTTYTTWKMTIERIGLDKVNGEMALRILYAMAHLSPDSIQRDLFLMLRRVAAVDDSIPTLTASTSTDLSESEGVSADRVKAGVRLLVKFSMVRAEDKQRVLSIHRLVQEVIKTYLRKHKSTNALHDACQIIALKRQISGEENWDHHLETASNIPMDVKNIDDKVRVTMEYVMKLGEQFFQREFRNEAEDLFLRLITFHEKYSNDHFPTEMLKAFATNEYFGDGLFGNISTAMIEEHGIVEALEEHIDNLMDDNIPFHESYQNTFKTGFRLYSLQNSSLPSQGRLEEEALIDMLEKVKQCGMRPWNCLSNLFLIYYKSEMFQESVELFWNLFPDVESITEDNYVAFATHLAVVLKNLGGIKETADLLDEIHSVLKGVHDLDLDLELD